MNREIVIPGGAGLYPLAGDVLTQPGNQLVTVVGIQGIAVPAKVLSGGETLSYNLATNQYVPTLRACVQVNNVTVSDDYIMTVNVSSFYSVNGVPGTT